MRRLVISALALLACVAGHAQDVVGGDGPESAAMHFTSFPRTAGALAFGGVTDVSPDFSHRAGVTLNYRSGLDVAADVRLFGKLVLDARFYSGHEEGVDTHGSNTLVGAGLACNFAGPLSLKAGVNSFRQELASEHSYTALGGDIFLCASLPYVRLSAGVENLTLSKVKAADGTEYDLPSAAVLDAAGEISFGKHSLGARAGAYYYLYGASRLGAGLEYGYGGLVFVRGGYCLGGDSPVPSFASLGLGLKLFGASLDACFLISDSMPDKIAIGLGYNF